MPLKDGIYIITNVQHDTLVFLPDPNHRTPLQGHFRRETSGELWHVKQRVHQRYSIQSVSHKSFANSGSRAQVKDVVEGDSEEQLWRIQESSHGNYTISTTDTRHFWSLPQDDPGTPVELYGAHTDRRCWWTFTNPGTESPVDESVTREAVLFELKLLPIVPFSPLMLDFVVIQQTSDDSVSNVSKTIGGICGPLASSMRPQPDTLRANILEFKPFESDIFFQRFTGFLTVENLCNVGGAGISWKKCRGSSLPEMAIRGLRADATKVAILDLNVTLLRQNGQAIINGLVKRNITLILIPIQPTFYKSDIIRKLRNLYPLFQPLEQMDKFSDYVVDYNEMVALSRFIEYPELRGAIRLAMGNITELLKDPEHEARSSAVTALSRLAEHAELHEPLLQAMPHLMEVLKDEDHDVRSAGIAVLSNFAEHEGLRDLEAIPRDSSGRTPLSWASGSGYDEVVRLLLTHQGIDVNSKDNTGRTPLSWAASNGHDEVVKLLLVQESIDANSRSKSDDTPLIWAAYNGHEGVVRLLLAYEGIEVDAKNHDGRTPLSWAALQGQDEVVKLLLARKGVDANSKSKDGYTPLICAADNGHEGVVRLLMAHRGINFNAKDNTGWTPLSWAAGKGHHVVVCLLLAHRGIDFNVKDNTSRTPLSWAAGKGHHVAVRLLLAHRGIDVNAKDNTGWTPLSWAAGQGHHVVVRLLLAHRGVYVNTKDNSGWTPLSWAVGKGHHAVVALLLAHQGIDVNAKDNTGGTPLSWAAANEHHTVVHLLRER